MTRKEKLAFSGVLLGILISGLVAGLILVRQRQELRKLALEGQPTITLSPASSLIESYSGLPIEIFFNTHNVVITKIVVRLRYQYQEEEPQIKFDLKYSSFASDLLAAGWACPVMTTSFETGQVFVDLECQNETGYSTSADTLLAKVLLRAYDFPQVNPFEVSFDPARSFVIAKDEGKQISFQILTSGIYEVVACIGCTPTPTPPTATPTPTPTPTSGVGGLQPTPTPTTAVGVTPTPTTAAGAIPTSTPTVSLDQLPETASITPTFLSLITSGVLLLFGFLLL